MGAGKSPVLPFVRETEILTLKKEGKLVLVVANENLSLPICVLGAFIFFIRPSFLAFNFPNVFSKNMLYYGPLPISNGEFYD